MAGNTPFIIISTYLVHAQPSSAACDPLELHGKAHTQCGATRRPWKAMEGQKDTCRGAYQIEVFRVSLALWSAASCRTFAGCHGANVRTGQGSCRGLATISNLNQLP